jgi:homoserine dehydrogenase
VPFEQSLFANDISAIYGILNGTTNYILTRMSRDGLDFAVALRRAQELGYAEAEPVNDIEGMDAAYKLAILAGLAFHARVNPQEIYREGVSHLEARDFCYAKEFGYAIKLLAIAKQEEGVLDVRVHPVFIPEDSQLAKVDGVYNAVQVEGDLIGRVIFYGEGAGASPTASAVMADVLAEARSICCQEKEFSQRLIIRDLVVKPVAEIEACYYLRLSAADRAGVLAQISLVLGDNAISIASVVQKESDPATKSAEIVVMTHPAREKALRKAIGELERLDVVRKISNFIRVEA